MTSHLGVAFSWHPPVFFSSDLGHVTPPLSCACHVTVRLCCRQRGGCAGLCHGWGWGIWLCSRSPLEQDLTSRMSYKSVCGTHDISPRKGQPEVLGTTNWRFTMTTRWCITVNLLRSPAARSPAPAKQLHYLQDECVLRYWLFLYMCLQCTTRYVLCLHG